MYLPVNTHSLFVLHPHKQAKRTVEREKVSSSVHWQYLPKEVRAPQRVLIGITPHPTLMFSSLLLPLEAWYWAMKPEVKYDSIYLCRYRETGSQTKDLLIYVFISFAPAHFLTLSHALHAAQCFESQFGTNSIMDQLSHWVSCITVT